MAGLLHENLIGTVIKDENGSVAKQSRNGKSIEELNGLSSLGIKYPTLRDHPLHTGYQWLESKRIDDGADGLWRIHDKLYDLGDFVKSHPGGEDWLQLTKGTDITEAFESHHLSELPESLLPTYFVRSTSKPRNSPFTFKDDGFYKTLRRHIHNKLKTVPKDGIKRSKYLTDLLFFAYISLSVLAVYFESFTIEAAAGVVLGLTAIASHNFFHQKDNFRMYYFDFTMMQSREWRISHALSHHLYTNTINDLEISAVEPFLQYLPTSKNIFFRYISWLYSPIFYAFLYVGHFIKTNVQSWLIDEHFRWATLLPFTVPILTYCLTQQPPLFCAAMFLWIIVFSSVYFGIIGVNAAHHHPDIFHDGDAIRPQEEMDWGIFQLDAVWDRKDITGSHFLVLTNFGDHALHHLFPTIDHGLLEHLYPIFLETCESFGVEWRLSSQLELIKGQFRQLSKVEPNKIRPGRLNQEKIS